MKPKTEADISPRKETENTKIREAFALEKSEKDNVDIFATFWAANDFSFAAQKREEEKEEEGRNKNVQFLVSPRLFFRGLLIGKAPGTVSQTLAFPVS